MMVRYIDAEQAIHLIENDALSQIYYSKSDAIDCINATPTADVVKVVRCKDCKHWKQVNEERRACYLFGFEMDYDEFCSYGTPKERCGEK